MEMIPKDGGVGASYLLFTAAFYWVFFWRFRRFPFANRRIGLLLMTSVWLLAANYAVYSNQLFHLLNFLVIPSLTAIHIVIITSPNGIAWHRLSFIQFFLTKLFQLFSYNIQFLACGKEMLK